MRRVLTALLLLPVVLAALLIGYGFLRTQWVAYAAARDFPPIGDYMEVAGERVQYLDTGPRTSDPARIIVLLHGASANLRDPMEQFGDALSRHYRIIAIDRPGHGWTSRNGGRGDAMLAWQSDFVVAVLKKLGIGQAVIMGHSWGGALALRIGLDHPEVARAVIAAAPVCYPWPGGIERIYQIIASPLLGRILANTIAAPVGEHMFGPALQLVFSPKPVPPDYPGKTGVRLALRPSDVLANAEDLIELEPQIVVQSPRYRDLKPPLLIITGDQDRIVSPQLHAFHLKEDVPGAELVVLPGSGHVAVGTSAERAVAAVHAFLDRLAKGPTAEPAASHPDIDSEPKVRIPAGQHRLEQNAPTGRVP